MRTLIGLIILIFLDPVCLAQDLSLTFTASGEAAKIDSITATNLNTGLYVKFPGNAVLRLNRITGNPADQLMELESAVFPNPFAGKAYLSIIQPGDGLADIRIIDIRGQVHSQFTTYLPAGRHLFGLTVSDPGVYFVRTNAGSRTSVQKIISIHAGGSPDNIRPENSTAGLPGPDPLLKSADNDYILGYKAGDLLYFKCFSGTMTTILTDRPAISKDYQVNFWTCTDPHGKNYPVVRIGTQTWMAENLAYLPTVRPASAGSVEWPYNYVYGYSGTVPDEARKTPNYSIYGVLYNWNSAMAGAASSSLVPSGVRGICPQGWHLPSNGEWSILTDFLGDSAGIRMKDTGAGFWPESGGGATNETGFGAIPAGIRLDDPAGFVNLGNQAAFWSATEGNASFAWYRVLDAESPQLTRYGIYKANGFSARCVRDE